jgi:hypothetical protein
LHVNQNSGIGGCTLQRASARAPLRETARACRASLVPRVSRVMADGNSEQRAMVRSADQNLCGEWVSSAAQGSLDFRGSSQP